MQLEYWAQGMPHAMLHGSRSLVVPNRSKGDTKEHRVSIQWILHFAQKLSMERKEEEKGRREKEMKSKMEGVIKEGNRERAKEKGFSEH